MTIATSWALLLLCAFNFVCGIYLFRMKHPENMSYTPFWIAGWYNIAAGFFGFTLVCLYGRLLYG